MGSVDLGEPRDLNVPPFSESTVGYPLPSPSGWGQSGTPRLSASCVTCSGETTSEGEHAPGGWHGPQGHPQGWHPSALCLPAVG